ncbi:MAG TPA: SIMPL domain-containing protein [Candidatus Udaeobacter sp.]|nr:SIMPL domain-containing protein [Candidatus Udaeobacter sp.]
MEAKMSIKTRVIVGGGLLIAIAAASVGALAMVLTRPAQVTPPQPQVLTLAASTTGNTITVVGVGTGTATPNEVLLNLGVSATRPAVRDAVTVAGSEMTKLMSAVHGQGVQDKDIQTTGIYIQQQTNCCPQSVIGYNATSQIAVTVHSVSGATPLIEAAVDAVGNDLQMNGITLTVSDQSSMMKAARAAAMNDANTKSQDWARLSGHHIGGLVGVSEIVSTASGFTCDQCGGKGGGGGGIQVQPGQTSITVDVAVTYELAA